MTSSCEASNLDAESHHVNHPNIFGVKQNREESENVQPNVNQTLQHANLIEKHPKTHTTHSINMETHV